MGILNKLLFWKRDDEFNFDEMAAKEMNEQGMPRQDNLGLGEKSPFQEMPTETGSQPEYGDELSVPQKKFSSPVSSYSGTGGNRDLELISSKLDTIKAMLASMEQRISNIEKATGSEQKKEQRLW